MQQVMYVTLNTPLVDMDRRMAEGQYNNLDVLFAHIKGRTKNISVMRDTQSFGMAMNDNEAGLVFVKSLVEGSTLGRHPGVCVGDQIALINGIDLTGLDHTQVAQLLVRVNMAPPLLCGCRCCVVGHHTRWPSMVCACCCLGSSADGAW